MSLTRSQTIRNAQKALDGGAPLEAEQMLLPLWEQPVLDIEVYRLLLECYMQQEKWEAAEQLILDWGEKRGELEQNDLLTLYLAQQEVDKAVHSLSVLIGQEPDFYESHAYWGAQFKAAGLEAEFLAELKSIAFPGYDAALSMAHYYALTNRDFETAIACLEAALERNPEDETVQGYLQHYRQELLSVWYREARKQLGGENPGDGLALYRKILDHKPDSVTAREYYLAALACKYVPPFYIYFHRNNFVSGAPVFFRAILFMIFCLIAALYYKGGKTAGATDHLQPVIWLFAVIAIPRYTLFPFTVQLLALRYVPGYHLLKNPYSFLKGAVLLSAWVAVLYNSVRSESRGFDFFLVGCFAITYVTLLESAEKNDSPLYRKLLNLYILFAAGSGALSYLKVIDDEFLFFTFGGWLPIILVSAGIDFYHKMQSPVPYFSGDEKETRYGQLTRRIHIGALVTAVLGFVLFIVSIRLFKDSIMINLSFGLAFYSITLFSFTEEQDSSIRFAQVWSQRPGFRWIFSLLSIGMMAGILAIWPYSSIPMHKTRGWIPGVAAFLGCWAGLFVLYYRVLRRPHEG